MSGFCFDWYAGAMAQLELGCPPDPAVPYQLKYTSPLRSTIRPPPQPTYLAGDAVRNITERLDVLVGELGLQRSAGTATPPPAAGTSVEETLREVGEQLQVFFLTPNVVSDLRVGELFLEIGVDEELVSYPWELMHDGEDHFCLKHAIGRFVNTAKAITALPVTASSPLGSHIDEISILLISVPRPTKRGDATYEELPGARAEAEVLGNLLSRVPGVKLDVLSQKDATYRNVFQRLGTRPYHIVHFVGHATMDEAAPLQSSLVLFDQDLQSGALRRLFTKNAPVLSFINACDSAAAQSWSANYNIYGLAQSLLHTGTYLLGSRWRLSDKGAPSFAETFYRSLLQECRALGWAVTDGRKACRASSPDDLAWASYVLYGDPRLQFRRL